MSKSEWDKMTDAELDRVTAERVMGWTSYKCAGVSGWLKNGVRHRVKWYPSTDIAHAFELLAQFESWSMRYDPEIKSVVVCVMYDGNRYYAMHLSPAKAITLAVMVAMGDVK